MRLCCRGDQHVGLFSHDASSGQRATQFATAARDARRNRRHFMALKELLHSRQYSWIRTSAQTENDLFDRDDGNGESSHTTCPGQHAVIGFAPAARADHVGVGRARDFNLPAAIRRTDPDGSIGGAVEARTAPPA